MFSRYSFDSVLHCTQHKSERFSIEIAALFLKKKSLPMSIGVAWSAHGLFCHLALVHVARRLVKVGKRRQQRSHAQNVVRRNLNVSSFTAKHFAMRDSKAAPKEIVKTSKINRRRERKNNCTLVEQCLFRRQFRGRPARASRPARPGQSSNCAPAASSAPSLLS